MARECPYVLPVTPSRRGRGTQATKKQPKLKPVADSKTGDGNGVVKVGRLTEAEHRAADRARETVQQMYREAVREYYSRIADA